MRPNIYKQQYPANITPTELSPKKLTMHSITKKSLQFQWTEKCGRLLRVRESKVWRAWRFKIIAKQGRERAFGGPVKVGAHEFSLPAVREQHTNKVNNSKLSKYLKCPSAQLMTARRLFRGTMQCEQKLTEAVCRGYRFWASKQFQGKMIRAARE